MRESNKIQEKLNPQKIMLEVLKSQKPTSQSFCLSFHAACLLIMDLAKPAVCVQRCHPRRHTPALSGCILGLKVMVVPDHSLGDLSGVLLFL